MRRRSIGTIAGTLVGLAGGLLIASVVVPSLRAQGQNGQFLTVRGLTIVDDRGIARLRLWAPLPDPVVLGKQLPRQGVVSGLMLYDANGDERGGYVTEARGDVFLTLDARQYQQAVFIANRDGGANLSVWSGPNKNDNYVSVQAVPHPLIEIVENGKKRVFTAQP
jgi:hypothetical protein